MSEPKSSNWIDTWTENIAKYKWLVVLASIALAMSIGSGGRFLGFSNDYRVFFGKDNPDLQAFEDLQNTYSKNDNVLIVVAPKNKNVFTNETLKAVSQITEDGWQVPYSTRVDSITNYQHTRAEGDDLIVEDLVDTSSVLSTEKLDDVKSIAVNEPLIVSRLISKSGHVTALNITVELPGKDPNEVLEVAGHVREKVAEYERAYPNLEFYLTGLVMLNEAFASSGQRDMMTLTPIMYAIILVMLAFLLKSVSATIATLIVIFMSVMAGMGFAGWIRIPLTPPSSIAPTVILTLAVADSVHILMIFLGTMRKGVEKFEALKQSLRLNMQPVFLTSVTTAIGFLSLNFSDQPPYHHLGNITAVGVGFAFLFSVTLLPALIMILPIRVKVTEGKQSPLVRAFSALADVVIAKSRPIFYVTAVIAVGLSVMVPTIELNDEFVEYFDKTVEFRNDTDFVLKNLTGIYQIDFSLPAKDSGGISEPEYLSKVEAFANWYREDERVVHVNTITDIMKRLNKNMHGDQSEWYRVPDTRNLAAQYLLLYEMSLPYGLDLNNQIDVDKSATRFTVTLQNVSAEDMRDLAANGENWLKENAPAYMATLGSGPSLMFSKISKRNVTSMTYGFILALSIITVFLIISLKSFGFGMLSIIPNVVPILMGMGIWAIVEGQAGTAISIVASVTLGIVVDDTIHFLSKFVRGQREYGYDVRQSIRYAFEMVGPALVVTSVVLILGFSVLLASSFRLNWSLGFLSATTLALALFADFIFLPSIMNLFIGGKKNEA